MAEIPFEAMLLGLESTAGTGVEPTHYASLRPLWSLPKKSQMV